MRTLIGEEREARLEG